MSDTVTVTLEEATNAQLLHFAQTVMGLDVNPGTPSTTLRSKIMQARPDIDSIEVPAGKPAAGTVSNPDGTHTATAAAESIPQGVAGLHFRYDPKVRLRIQGTTEATRAKDVQIACQGEVIILRRDRDVEIPYRHFLVLKDAIETVARDTDEINPLTGLPIKEWVEQNSYPYQILAMPSEEEIAAWHKRTSALQLI